MGKDKEYIDTPHGHFLYVAAEAARRHVDAVHRQLTRAQLGNYDVSTRNGTIGAKMLVQQAILMLDLLGFDVSELSHCERDFLADRLAEHWVEVRDFMFDTHLNDERSNSKRQKFLTKEGAREVMIREMTARQHIDLNALTDTVQALAADPLWQFLVLEFPGKRAETDMLVVKSALDTINGGFQVLGPADAQDAAERKGRGTGLFQFAPLFSFQNCEPLKQRQLFRKASEFISSSIDNPNEPPHLFVIASDDNSHNLVDRLNRHQLGKNSLIGFQHLNVEKFDKNDWIHPKDRPITAAAAAVKSAEHILDLKVQGKSKNSQDRLFTLWQNTKELQQTLNTARRVNAGGGPSTPIKWPELELKYRDWTAPGKPGGDVKPGRGSNRRWQDTKPAVYFQQYLADKQGIFTLDDIRDVDRPLYLAILNGMKEWPDYDIKLGLLPRARTKPDAEQVID
ncbi:MAG: hypothetical protein AAFQ79_01905 [Pseudomonadota bacterium]